MKKVSLENNTEQKIASYNLRDRKLEQLYDDVLDSKNYDDVIVWKNNKIESRSFSQAIEVISSKGQNKESEVAMRVKSDRHGRIKIAFIECVETLEEHNVKSSFELNVVKDSTVQFTHFRFISKDLPANSTNQLNSLITTAERSILNYYFWQVAEGNSLVNDKKVFNQFQQSKVNYVSNYNGNTPVNSDLEANLQGVEAVFNHKDVHFLAGENVSSLQSQINHQMPNTHSDQTIKTIVKDKADWKFVGEIVVPQDSQKISAKQLNKNLQLSDTSHVMTKPQLRIAADDVTCSHGATVGGLDENHLFFLQSRGLDLGKAKDILLEGFIRSQWLDIGDTLLFNSMQSYLKEGVEWQS